MASTSTTDVKLIPFEGIMSGKVTNFDGNFDSSYDGEGNSKGRVKEFNSWEDGIWVEEDFVEEENP